MMRRLVTEGSSLERMEVGWRFSQKSGGEMRFKTVCISFLSLMLIVSFISCNQNKTKWKGSIEVVDGVPIVKNPKEGLWDSKENVAAAINKKLQIGELYGPDEFLFVNIQDVAVNSSGDIFIADRELNEIRKFNKQGEYIQTLGKKGEGPGEFLRIWKVSINSNQELLAYDRNLDRVSIFSDNGKHIETTKRLSTTPKIYPNRIFDIDRKYLIFGSQNNSLKLLHEFNKDWEIVRSYLDYTFIDDEEFEKHSLRIGLGKCWIHTNGDLLYTKYYYDNKILIYRDGELLRVISRESDVKKPYSLKKILGDPRKAMREQKNQGYDVISVGQGVGYFAKTHQLSLGIFQLSNGHIVNFVWKRMSKELKDFGAEVFDSTGKFLFYSKLGENIYYDIRSLDSEDFFYAIDRKEFGKVIVFKLDY